MIVSLDEQIAAVDRCLEDFRHARSQPGTLENKTYFALRAIADELRGRKPEACRHTLRLLAARVDAARSVRMADGAMRGVAEVLISRWPTVRQALEKFEREDANGRG